MNLVTKADADGMVAAMLLRSIGLFDVERGDLLRIVHPIDVLNGKIKLSEKDIIVNLPYNENVGMAFIYNSSEWNRLGYEKSSDVASNLMIDTSYVSASHMIYDYYGEEYFKDLDKEIIKFIDKAANANYTINEVVRPEGWDLIHFIMDSQTGLGRYYDYRISNYALMKQLILSYNISITAEDILNNPDVNERVKRYYEDVMQFEMQLVEISEKDGKVVVVDQRQVPLLYAGNRFIIYALHPEAELSIHITPGENGKNTAIMIAKSMLHKNNELDIGKICNEYGGVGHKNAGSIQVANEDADKIVEELLLNINGEMYYDDVFTKVKERRVSWYKGFASVVYGKEKNAL